MLSCCPSFLYSRRSLMIRHSSSQETRKTHQRGEKKQFMSRPTNSNFFFFFLPQTADRSSGWGTSHLLRVDTKLIFKLLWFLFVIPALGVWTRVSHDALPHSVYICRDSSLCLSVFFVDMPRCVLLILFLRILKLATGSAFSVKKKKNMKKNKTFACGIIF